MISLQHVHDALNVSLGSAFANDQTFSNGLIRVLSSFPSACPTLTALSRCVADYLFNALYDRLGYEMRVQLNDGTQRRIYMADLPDLADALLMPLFLSFLPDASHYGLLHDFWMSTGSLSAMRVLRQRYSSFLPEQERALMDRVEQENQFFLQ
jgi:hypothetical protein